MPGVLPENEPSPGRPYLARSRLTFFPTLGAALRDPLGAPLAERPDRPLFYFNSNRSTKNVGHFLRIDVVAQVPSPSLAWRC